MPRQILCQDSSCSGGNALTPCFAINHTTEEVIYESPTCVKLRRSDVLFAFKYANTTANYDRLMHSFFHFVEKYHSLDTWFRAPLPERIGRLYGEDYKRLTNRVSCRARSYLMYLAVRAPRLRHRRQVELTLAEEAESARNEKEAERHRHYALRFGRYLLDMGEPLDPLQLADDN